MPSSRRSRLVRAALAGVTVLVVGPLSTTQAAAEDAAAGDTVVGELVRTFADPYDREEATALHEEPLTWVEPARGAAVRLTGERAEDLPVGATVEVELGDQVVDAAAAAAKAVGPAREVVEAEVLAAAAEPVSATAVHQVTVALVAPFELPVPQPTDLSSDTDSAEEFAALVEGPVAAYWARQTYRAVQLDVVPVDADNGWTKSQISCTKPFALWKETATRVGFTPGPGKHLLLYLPEEADPDTATYDPCSYGWGSVGSDHTTGGAAYVRDDEPSVITHELGHNFGLGHSSLVQCDSAIEGPAECGYFGYLDLYDVMGASWGPMGSLSALHARRMKVLPLSRVHRVAATAPTRDYALSPIGTRTGYAGIQLSLGDDVYWLEYRTATGQDTWLGEPGLPLETGVLLRRADDGSSGDTSLLLDGTPSPSAGWEDDLATSLPAGRSYWLAGGAFHVTVKSTTASQAVVRVSTVAGAPVPRDLSGDYAADLVVKDPAGTLLTYESSATGGFGPRVVSARGWQSRDLITMAGDWDGDGAHDVIARDSRNGDLWLYRGNNGSGFVGWRVIGRGWGGFDALLAPGDWNGDGFWDLVARKRDGSLMLYPGNGAGGFKLAGVKKIGNGWGVMTALAASGDWDNDGTVDLLARHTDGRLLHYPGNGSGGFRIEAVTVIGRGWQVFTGITGPGDWDGDGDADLIARRSDGSMHLYRGNGVGGFTGSSRIGAGWSGFRLGS